MDWCRSYVERRLAQTNPKDRGDPFLQYNRLWLDELDPIFHPHLDDSSFENETGSLDFVIVDECQTYAAWLLFERTIKRLLSWQRDGSVLVRDYRPINPEVCQRVIGIVKTLGLHQDRLGEFLKAVREFGDVEKLSEFSRRESSYTLDLLKGRAMDIQEMRAYLIRNFDSAKTIIEVGRSLVLAWDWAVQYGIANILGVGTPTAAIEAIRSRHADYLVKVAPDGRLLDPKKPWIGTGSPESGEVQSGLPENAYVLDLFYDRLLSFYDRIDFDRIRRRAKALTHEPEGDDESLAVPSDEILSVSCLDLAARVFKPDTKAPRRRIPALRLEGFLGLLTRSFGCQYKHSKGSEITVFRPGHKQFTLPSHGKNPEISTDVVKQLLKRLGISAMEWLRVVYD
jgi:hypothetical protein